MQREYILRGERVVIDELEGVVAIKAGDADLKQHDDIDDFETHYGGVLDLVTTFMLPHHGSIQNSDPARLVGWPDIWVAAAEPVHAWDHPAKQLKVLLRKRLVQVTSSRTTELVERFLVEWWP